MYGTKHWDVTVDIDEDEEKTTAEASVRSPGNIDVTGIGQASRNPLDPDVPDIGDELAVARALRDLSERLLHATERDITQISGKPAHVHR
ncbi:DUF1876 domain-containing protein [Agromyces sp. MMS24-K17]|uniref:DUF1876 domain-containing protein n=1 Tax=Agromyces sp. MMS24-K17 TaxID=3372850 RepID=UPI003754CC8B